MKAVVMVDMVVTVAMSHILFGADNSPGFFS